MPTNTDYGIPGLTQKLHDLVHCRATNPLSEDGMSRAEMYFSHRNPSNGELSALADQTARAIANILLVLPGDSPYVSQCEYALSHCGYERTGVKK